MLQIPVVDADDSLIEVSLDGETYFIDLVWNPKGQFWAFGLESASHDVLLAGIPVLPDRPLIGHYRIKGMPIGEFMAIAPDGLNTISRTDLPDGTVSLIYMTDADLPVP